MLRLDLGRHYHLVAQGRVAALRAAAMAVVAIELPVVELVHHFSPLSHVLG